VVMVEGSVVRSLEKAENMGRSLVKKRERGQALWDSAEVKDW